MKAPKCKLCGHEHWGREPHVYDPAQLRAWAREREERRMPGHGRRKRERDAEMLRAAVAMTQPGRFIPKRRTGKKRK